ncbi:MAG: transcriptional repressor [Verrucomicrobiota bacterium]
MIASTQTNHPLAAVSSGVNRTQRLDEACNRLKQASLRVTQPRVAILKAMIAQPRPVSIEQIHQSLSDSACDLVTVYRCLAAFEAIGLVRRSFFHNGTSLYQIQSAGTTGYHIINKSDRDIEPLPEELAQELSGTIRRIEDELRAKGYTDVSHSVEFFTGDAKKQPPASVEPVAQRAATNVEIPAQG